MLKLPLTTVLKPFQQSRQQELTVLIYILWIQGTNWEQSDHCRWAGLLLHCTVASNHDSPWHNFVSGTKHWKAKNWSPYETGKYYSNGIISLLIKEVNRIWFQQSIKTTYSGKTVSEVQFCTTKRLQFCEFKVASCRLTSIKTSLEVVKIAQNWGTCMPIWHLLNM